MTNTNHQSNPPIERLVLDTHVLIWYLEGIELNEEQVQIIEQQRAKNQLFVSAISIWEVAMLINKKRAALSIPITEWLHRVQNIPGLNILDLSLNILVESCNLLNYEHRDPADRFIIASTRALNGHLMTFDRKILEYAENGYLWACH
jgi:PIN domain nuclease of toxin-antitoxin system